LVVHAELIKMEESTATLKTRGLVGEGAAVSGKLVLQRFNIGDRLPQRGDWDDYARNVMRRFFESLLRTDPSSQS
ncbi:MAG: hypothetical protein JJ992_07625, partial [Planctomycetes bacterium]|nr:hypothetical protein [Planctomycetota bacterium]